MDQLILKAVEEKESKLENSQENISAFSIPKSQLQFTNPTQSIIEHKERSIS